MNAAIRSTTRMALYAGAKVYAVYWVKKSFSFCYDDHYLGNENNINLMLKIKTILLI